jgi:RNA polymerase sigma factor (sigma-70 family)
MGRIGPDELGRLFDAHSAALVLYARQWSESPEDIVQDAFVKLARQWSCPDRLVPWLYRVVRNQAIAIARSKWRRNRRESRASNREAWFASTDERIDGAEAAKFLEALEPECREVIVARIWGGLTFDEIARLQGSSLTTVYRRYQTGISCLHERLERPWTPQNLIPKTT